MKRKLIRGFVLSGVFLVIFFAAFAVSRVWATEKDPTSARLEDLLRDAWAASSHADYTQLDELVRIAQDKYEAQAMALHVELQDFPDRDKIENYKVMNNVATILFVKAEALMHQGKSDDAIKAFKELIKKYPYAQSWDPSRGSYWPIARISQESIDKLTGAIETEVKKIAPTTKPKLAWVGEEAIVDYQKYGTFTGVGTKEYKYKVGNPNALAIAVGEGIYPNTGDVLKNPRYKEVYKEGRLNGTHWDFVNTPDLEAAYFKWATAGEAPGVKLFYTGLIFEKAKMYLQAVKAYYALIVHFPSSAGWTYWHTTWFPAQAAVAKIKNILRLHPELGLDYINGKIRVLNANDPKKIAFVVWPGEIVRLKKKVADFGILSRSQINGQMGIPKRSLGGKKVRLVKYKNGHWELLVYGKPFIIKGITYSPTKVGQSPDNGTLENWMFQDHNGNGKTDSPYESWVDKNRNGVQDKNEPVVGDFQLLKEMGVNAIRLYDNVKINKGLLQDLYKQYGIMVIMSDYLGKYAIGSGATWAEGTDYENPDHRAKMLENVEKMVREFKDEPYILMWVLGNENNYGVASNADKKPVAYYKFVNEVARRIKEIDPDRPVALCNGDTLFLDLFARYAPYVDAYGGNVYRGDYGFGSFWDEVKLYTDKPAFITEYGAPGYDGLGMTMEEAEQAQADYHKGNWLDILHNSAGYDGEGNAIGGIAFEWMDEWWKNYEPAMHDTKADVIGPFPGGYYYEEWFGLVGQGSGKNSPFERQLRKCYFMYKDIWNRQ
jgi:tetratricopeptide (TPR) repeat protein